MAVKLEELYKQDADNQRMRYEQIAQGFQEQYGSRDGLQFFSAPGRTEIGGNHTDHNHGRVLAAGINLDIVAAARRTDDGKVQLKSMEYPKVDCVDLTDLEHRIEEEGSSAALIKGVCARCRELGYEVGGFEAYTMTQVLKGSGLSSSAAFEVVVVTIINHLYNNGKIDDVTVAAISQYAENVYFGKPSGLMDQMASSVGSVIAIDFEDNKNPKIEKIDFDLEDYGHALCIVDTGGNHADLTEDYAAITVEMKAVANFFGKDYLRELNKEEFMQNIPALRIKAGDRAILRSLHFFEDDMRAAKEAEALKRGDFSEFCSLVNSSGLSSEAKLQNIFSIKSPNEQGLSLALALTRMVLNGRGACRVHGGGFAGTIQAFVPLDILEAYKMEMERVFGENSCYVLSFRNSGGVQVELS